MRIPFLSRSRFAPAANLDDALAAFGSESSPVPARPIATPAPAPLAGRLPLQHVIDRRTPIAWFEAVAVVEALCRDVVTPDGPDRQVPGPDGVFIHASGEVTMDGRASSDPPTVQLAHTLHSLLTGDGVPTPLRLFVSRWTSGVDLRSVTSFAEDLHYFARSEPTALIAAVYQRCLTQPEMKPVPEAKPKKALEQPRRPKKPLVIAAAVVTCAATGTALWVASGGPPTASLAASWPAMQLGALFTSTPAGVTDVETTSEPEEPRASTRRRASRLAPGSSVGTVPATGMNAVPSLPEEPPLPSAADALEPFALTTAVPMVTTPLPDTVYSEADGDVLPPRMTYPQLPPPLATSDSVNTLEVVVGVDGSVERVRLVSPARRLPDMMMLSGAKAWVFEPARKNGLPVRYRQQVSWTAEP